MGMRPASMDFTSDAAPSLEVARALRMAALLLLSAAA
ncbi:MAG: hypothetical protein RIS92_435 [Verrucomicrobiota bacterium]